MTSAATVHYGSPAHCGERGERTAPPLVYSPRLDDVTCRRCRARLIRQALGKGGAPIP